MTDNDNQLVAEAQQQIDDMDEFAGMSIKDIAHNIIAWPDDSEDQRRAIVAIRARAPGMGHNRAPLAEALDDELAALTERQRDMLTIAGRSMIVDEASATKVTNLTRQISDLESLFDDMRKKRVRPYLEAQRLINGKFNDLIEPLTIARQGTDRRGGLSAMLTQWDDKKKAEAEAERQRVLAEARQREQEAEAARRAAEEKAAAGKASVADELEVMRAQDEAERLQAKAEAIRPEPTRGHLGQVTRRREIRFEVNSVRETIGWMLKQDGLAGQLRQEVFKMIGRYLNGLGVDTVARGVKIPGVEVRIEQGQATVRR